MSKHLIIRSIAPFTITRNIEGLRLADKYGNYLVLGLIPHGLPDDARERRVLVRFPTDGGADRCGAIIQGNPKALLSAFNEADAAIGEVEKADHPGVIVYGNPLLLPPLIQASLVNGKSRDVVPADLSPETIATLWSVGFPEPEKLMATLSGSAEPPAVASPEPVGEPDLPISTPDREPQSEPRGTSRARGSWRLEPATRRQKYRAAQLVRDLGLEPDFDLETADKGTMFDFIRLHMGQEADTGAAKASDQARAPRSRRA